MTAVSVATWNAAGIAGKDSDLAECAGRMALDFVFVCETWARTASRAPSEEFIVWSPKPRELEQTAEGRTGTGRNSHGVALWARHGIDRAKLRIVGGKPGLSIWWKYGSVLYGGIYLPPRMSTEECLGLLGLGPETEADLERIVLLGDLNMRLGALSGDSEMTPRGQALAGHLMMERGMILMTDALGSPTFQAIGREGSSIVDQIWSNLGREHFQETGLVGDDDLGGSDHRLVYARVLMEDGNPESDGSASHEGTSPTARLFNLGKLKQRHYQESYQGEVRNGASLARWQMQDVLTEMRENPDAAAQDGIDRMESIIQGVLEQAAERTLGTREAYRRRNTVILRHPPYREARRRRRRAFRNWQRDPQNEGLQLEYREARRDQDRALREARELAFHEFADRVERMRDTERSKVFASMVRTRTRGKATMLSCDRASLEQYAQYFEGQLARRDFHWAVVPEEVPMYDTPAVPFGLADIQREMRILAKGKSPGAGGLRNELLIYAAVSEMVQLIATLFCACWRTAMTPSSWRVAMIFPVPKKGDLRRIENYRPISLTESLRKLYERVLLKGLCEHLEPLDICQGGFRAQRSTLEQVAALHESIQQRRRDLKRWPIVAYLDIKAAYDTVDRRVLWNILAERRLPREWLLVLKGLFDHNSSQVVIGGYRSRQFGNVAGLMQGSVLSPILYAAFIDALPGRLREYSSSTLGEIRNASFFYADDIALLCDDKAQLKNMLATCENFSRELGFQFSPSKCEIVGPTDTDYGDCCLYGQPLKCAQSFVYLGVTFTLSGIDPVAHVTRNAAKAIDSINLMRMIGCHGGGFAISVRRRAYETFIRPKLEYGLQLLEPSGTVLRILERVQYQALCAMFSVSRNTSRAALHGLAGVQSMKMRVWELNAMWQARVEQLPAGFMIREARKEHARRKVAKSVFLAAKKNPVYEEYRRTRENTAPGAEPADEEEHQWRSILESQRARWRGDERKTLWETSSTQLEGIRERKDETAKMIDGCATRRCRRMVTLWVLKRIPGKPKPCPNCRGAERTSRRHVLECCQVDPTTRLAGGQILAALEEISVILRKCLGWTTSKLTRDIIREHTAWVRREVALAASRANFDRPRGSHAYWRYFADRP